MSAPHSLTVIHGKLPHFNNEEDFQYSEAIADATINEFKISGGISMTQGTAARFEDVACHSIEKESAVYGVFDGHGGYGASNFCGHNLPEIVRENLKTINENGLEKSFIECETKFADVDDGSGTTAACVVLHEGVCHFAHAGDSRILLRLRKIGILETRDHSPISEKKRITSLGGSVSEYVGETIFGPKEISRVNGQLAVSRAIGDFKLNKKLIICTPDVYHHPMADIEYVLIVSDGVLDKYDMHELITFCEAGLKEKKSPTQICKDILKRYIKGAFGSVTGHDNSTMMLLCINKNNTDGQQEI